jgi:pimeloyl-ACP methyl ester carboxylesterase
MRFSPLLFAALAAPATAAATTLDITLDGRPSRAEVFAPPAPATDAVVLVHGFMRSRSTMTGHAEALAREGVVAIAPDMPYWVDSRDNARALADLVAQLRRGEIAGRIERVVLVGFSAGGLAALLAASTPGVVGYVGLDAFDRPGGVGLKAARRLPVPSKLLRSPPSFCNAYGIASPWAAALPSPTQERLIEGATHCDFESPTDRACTLFCGATDPDRQQIVRRTLIDAVREWLPSGQRTQGGPAGPVGG